MKPTTVYILLLFSVKIIFAQTWSSPKNISGSGLNVSPDLKIDKNGVIHCVWTHYNTYSFSKIYYSKSSDDGNSWTEPIPITSNSSFLLDEPHIVIDTIGNIFVSYDYDIGGNAKIFYVKFDAVTATWNAHIFVGYGSYNRILIDHNNRVYFFCFAGTEFYRFLDNNILSEPLSPNSGYPEHFYFDNLTVDEQNKIFCVGNRTAGDHSHGAYFTCVNNEWAPFTDISSKSFFESGVSLNSIGIPSFVWRQIMPDSLPNVRGTYYAKLESDSVGAPFFFAQKTSYPSISVDCNDKPHIIESQKIDSGYKLVHRYLSEGLWNTEVLDSNENWYDRNVIISNKTHIYLLYNKIDTSHFSQTGFNAMVVYRKLDIPSAIIESFSKPKLLLYPNPFSETITIEWLNSNSNTTFLQIFDLHGNILYTEEQKDKSQGIKKIVKKVSSCIGKQIENGPYIVRVSNGSFVLSNILLGNNK